MLLTSFNYILGILNSIWGWVNAINLKLPFLSVALGLLVASLALRYLLMPMLHTSFSDSASTKHNRS